MGLCRVQVTTYNLTDTCRHVLLLISVFIIVVDILASKINIFSCIITYLLLYPLTFRIAFTIHRATSK